MTEISDIVILPLVDKAVKQSEFASQALHPKMSYQIDSISNIGSDIEKQRLNLITGIINKRKAVRDRVINKIDDLIVYCDNRVLEIGEEARFDHEIQKQASLWQCKIVDLEMAKMGEEKELFRDILFLRNEWVKSLLNYVEEKRLGEAVENLNIKIPFFSL